MFLNDLSFFSGPSEKLILDNFLTAVVLTELSLLLESPAQLPIKADPPASYSPMWTSSIRGKSEKTALQATGGPLGYFSEEIPVVLWKLFGVMCSVQWKSGI